MKHTKHILLMATLLLGSLSVSAYDFEVDGIYYDIKSRADLTVEVTFEKLDDEDSTYSPPYSGIVIIPETVNYNGTTYRVTAIGGFSFRFCTSLTNITIPESVTTIEGWAFYGCSGLTSITIPKSVTSIGECTFFGCSSLTSVTIPEGVTSIGNEAFRNCTSLTSITIPESVTKIGSVAFASTAWYNNQLDGVIYINNVLYKYKGGMPENTSFKVREGTISITPYAFYGCSGLTSITIPESVTSIGDEAFSNCTSLTSITIPEGMTEFGHEAFAGTAWYNNQPDGLVYVGKTLYGYKGKMAENSSIEVRKGTVGIGSHAFRNCDNLTSITIPKGVTSIGSGAFAGCDGLTSINIPESVTEIGEDAFNNCNYLTSVTIPEGSKLTSIGSRAFAGCDGLTSITIPESVTSIGDGAFSSCFHLTSVTIPKDSKLTSIGSSAFVLCWRLTSIAIPESVTTIGDEAFSGCGLTSVVLPQSLTYISNSAFAGCELASVVLPQNLTHISSGAFANCESLLDVYCYAEQVPEASESAFENSYPENITLHVPIKSLNDYKTTAPWSSFGAFETIGSISIPVSSITLSETSLRLTVGDVWQLSVTEILPENATDKSVIWAYDSSVATVDREGKVHALAPGTGTIYVRANDGSNVYALCEVTVVEDTSYSLTFMVDGQVFQTETSETPIEVVFPEAPEKEGYSFVRWELSSSDATLTNIDIANNADEMLYSNAPCTNTKYGDQFTSWDVLFDDDYNTFFHSEYSEDVDSEDGLDHYLRVDMGEGNSVDQFAFNYAMRGDQYPNHTPTKIIVEGSNEANGKYDTIAVLTDLAEPPYDIDYTSEILGNGKEYRYIRYRVARTLMNSLVCGHPYFYISEFGMKKAQNCYNAVYQGVYAPNKYKVYYYVGEELQGIVEVTYGDQMPNMLYSPTLDTEEFLGWISEDGETYETMPAHDVTYTANIKVYEKCATPTISYANNRVVFSCETEGVTFRTQVKATTERGYRNTDSEGFEFVPTYTFTTYAIKDGFVNSDDVSVTICWIDCTEKHESGDEDMDITSVPSQPVIIQCVNGVITITGLSDGTAVAVYDTAGMGYGTAVAENGAATIATNLEAGSTAIVKIGERSVKVAVK